MNLTSDQIQRVTAAYQLLNIVANKDWEERGHGMSEHDISCNAFILIRDVFKEIDFADEHGNLHNVPDKLVEETLKNGYRPLDGGP